MVIIMITDTLAAPKAKALTATLSTQFIQNILGPIWKRLMKIEQKSSDNKITVWIVLGLHFHIRQ